MKKTTIYFNENGLVRETSTVNKTEDTNFDEQKSSIEEVLKREGGNIDFEPIPEEKPEELTIEEHLEKLEKKQDQIIQMLQLLCNQRPKFKGYLTINEATERYKATRREIHKQVSWFQRVRHIKIDKKVLDGKTYYKEEDLVEAMLFDIRIESKRQFDLLKLTSPEY